jgi:hypothetical protein
VEEIKSHPFFRGVNWDTLREQTAYFIPTLKSPIDTSNFEEYEPLEDEMPTHYRSHSGGGSPKDGISPVNARKIKMPTEKDLPFIGYTYKAFDIPKRAPVPAASTAATAGAVRRPTIEEVFDSTGATQPQ